jgi:hypothetical protein
MPIKRAGPFASSTNSFLDESETPTSSIVPVNRNNHPSASWKWRAFVSEITGVDEVTFDPIRNEFYQEAGESSFFFAGSQYDTGLDISVSFRIDFFYQATQEWSFSGSTIPISINDEGGGLGPGYSVRVTVAGTEVFNEGEFEASADVSIDSVVFPASVVPKRVQINVSATAFSTSDATVTASITLPLAIKLTTPAITNGNPSSSQS